jgi:Nif-specific regulatory protein
MPDTIIESELLGNREGRLHGCEPEARGQVRGGQRGNICLDEVVRTLPLAQAKLLRVIQERKFQPLGSNSIVKVNVRSTPPNRDLVQDVASQVLDDCFTASTCSHLMPPLRERGGDILLLADYFVE